MIGTFRLGAVAAAVRVATASQEVAPTYVAGNVVTYAVATSQAATIPAGVQVGDLLLAWVMHRDNLTPPAGWTLVRNETCTGGSPAIRHDLSLYQRTAQAGDAGASTTWTQATSQRIAVHIQAWRHASGAVLNAASGRKEDSGTSPELVDFASITPTRMGIVVHGASNIVAQSPGTATASTGTLTTPASENDNRLFVAYRSPHTAGQTLTGNFTTNTTPSPNGEVAISVAITSNVDPSFANVALLLSMDGTNGSTTFTDRSGTPKTVTANGNAQISTAQSRFGGASAYFDGAGDFLAIPEAARPTSTEDFCIECWVFVPSYPATETRQLYSQHQSGVAHINFELRSDGFFAVFLGNTSTYFIGNVQLPLNQWAHIALSRNGTAFRLFQNGTQIASATANPTIGSAGTGRIGREGGTNVNWDWLGYIDEFRITRGVARYTANFTPPAAPFPAAVEARYWRFRDLVIPGGGYLEIGELALFVGATRQTGATITSSDAPGFGSTADLNDANTSTRAFWLESVAEAAGFWIQFDFGAGNTRAITGFQQSGFDNNTRYIQGCRIEYSNDGTTWTTKATVSGLTYPGNLTYSATIAI